MELKGIACRTGKSKNGRTYTEDSLGKAMDDYYERVNRDLAFGELGHPDTGCFETFSRVSHKINSIKVKWDRVPRKKRLKKLGIWESWKGYNLKTYVGEIEILDTDKGKLVKDLYQSKTPISLALRSIGNVDSDGVCYVDKIISFDIVSTQDLAMDNGELKRIN